MQHIKTVILPAVVLAIVGCAAATIFAADQTGSENARRPNIVLIVADDLGVSDLGCYGRQEHSTPRLDELARQGMRFTAAYAAAPVCSPTRAALLTGQAPARLQLTTFLPGRGDAPSQLLLQAPIVPHLPLTATTLAERLGARGYRSAYIGKWHLGGAGFLPTDQGFDTYFAGTADTQPTADEGGKGEYALTAEAEKFVAANRERPFFLYLAHNCPHIPLAAQPDRIAKHAGAYNPTYAAMIETLDDSVGRLVDQLDKLGLAEQTLIIFTSDNGGLHVPEGPNTPATHNTPFRAGKGFCYEGGLRVPLVVRWPKRVPAGQTNATPVISTDWAPTLLALSGVDADAPNATDVVFDGVSLAGLLTREQPLPARELFWHSPHYMNQGGRPTGAIRAGEWKLVEHYENGALELFDLFADPSETTDLAPREPGRVAELRGKLEAWRRQVGAAGNQANPNFRGDIWEKLYQSTDVSRLAPGANAAECAASLVDWRRLLDNAAAPGGIARGNGAVILSAREARIHGEPLRFEPEPHKDTIGYWVNPSDWAEWEFEIPQAGLFDVEILQGCGQGSGGAEIEIACADQTLTTKVFETGHFQRFVPRNIGTLRFADAGPQTLSVRAKSKPGPAVMDLRRITLRAQQ